MSKPDPASTGQADATATGNIYQNLINQQEQYTNQQQQAQRGAAASLALPQGGADTAGATRNQKGDTLAAPPSMGATPPPVDIGVSDPAAQAAPAQSQPTQSQPTQQAAPADPTAAQGAPTGAGQNGQDGQKHVFNTIQHIVNALDPQAKMRSQAPPQRTPVMAPLPGQAPGTPGQ
jgi:hypothetical protein